MDTALTPATPLAPADAGALSLNRLQSLPMRNKLVLAFAALLLVALAIAGMSMGREGEWKVLYANLNDKDGGSVIAALTQMGVPHRFSEGGGAILVPAQQVHDARLKLASQGLPKGGTVGFELMENQRFGTTQFQERLNFQRGLEGELARSIMALSAVQAARVHLALPNQSAFMRDQQKPSASVLLTLYGGRTLDRGQIAGIVHLVASSVPELNPRAVSVVDQTGALLSQAPGEVPNGLDASQQQYVRQTEQSLSSRILAIVEPIVGPGNVKAQVTADIDFTQTESTAETYGPNQGSAPAAVRQQQLSEAPGAGAGLGGGVAGALANQPPATPTSPVNGTAAPVSGNAAPGSAGSGVKRDATTMYEVDKTVRVVRNATGNVRRLNAAVIVNHASAPGPDGKPALKALTPAQMEQINALVREAMGFSKDRGDSVNVVNAPFTQAAADPAADLPIWRQPETLALARSLGPWVAMPLVALIIILGLVRPALKAARRAPPLAPPRMLETTVHDAVSLPTPISANAIAAAADLNGVTDVPLLAGSPAHMQQGRMVQLETIRQLVRDNPATVANVVRNWTRQPA